MADWLYWQPKETKTERTKGNRDMRKRMSVKKCIGRIILGITGLICGTTCAFYVVAETQGQALNIPDGTVEIANYENYGKTEIATVALPASVQKIGISAFDGCTSLASVQMQDGLQSIANRAFAYCNSLQVVSLPNSINSLGNAAFSDCSSLININLPSSINKIENNLFYQCSSLGAIAIPSSVTSIGQQSFYECRALTEVQLPARLSSIGAGAFYDCEGLTSITIPDSVSSIGSDAFRGCSNLTIQCSSGSYAEQYAAANGIKVNANGSAGVPVQAKAVTEDNAVDTARTEASSVAPATQEQEKSPQPKTSSDTNQNITAVPKTGIRLPYGFCFCMMIASLCVLRYLKQKERDMV